MGGKQPFKTRLIPYLHALFGRSCFIFAILFLFRLYREAEGEALFGEAVVVPDPSKLPNFRYMIKQGGGLLAKGRLLGIQFTALFTDDLYMKVSRHAIAQSDRIRSALNELGFRIYIDSPTNQQFFVVRKDKFDELTKEFALDLNCFLDDEDVVARACTSWATKEENVDLFISALNKLT